MHCFKIILTFTLIPMFVQADEEIPQNDTKEFRKHYGLSLNDGCAEYVKVFKCMSTCKSLSYKIYRVDFLCKCSCHVMKTTTILPFFKWRTNGTTRAPPKTKSPGQYDVVGTLSPPSVETTTTITTVTVELCPRLVEGNGTAGNGTDSTGPPDAGAPQADASKAPENKAAGNADADKPAENGGEDTPAPGDGAGAAEEPADA